MYYVERLESLIANGKKVFLSKGVMIDQAEALDWVDKLRDAIPEEIRVAKQVNSEVDALIENAREEASKILAHAHDQAVFLIEERQLTQQAEEMGDEIVRQAQAEANQIMRGADDYAAEVLVNLEGSLTKTLKSVKLGLELLDGGHHTEVEESSAVES